MDNVPSNAVEREREFLRFILTAKEAQCTLLLRTLTRSQTNAISEIFLNILHSETVKPELLESVKRYRNLIRTVGSVTNSYKVRKGAISRHPRIVLKILLQLENILPFSQLG